MAAIRAHSGFIAGSIETAVSELDCCANLRAHSGFIAGSIETIRGNLVLTEKVCGSFRLYCRLN